MRPPVITADQVATIRRLLAGGHSQRNVAEVLNISRASVKKYQTEEAIDRRRDIAAKANAKATSTIRQRRRKAPPPDHQAIRTASPIMRQLFEEMWRQGLRQADVGKQIGVSHNALTLWKKGHTGPSLFSVEAMAQVLGLALVLKPRE